MLTNRNFFDDYTETQIKYLIVFGLIAIAVFIFIFKKSIVKEFNWSEQNKVWRKEEFEQKYFGVVVNKGRDNRNNTFITLKDSSKIFQNEKKIWERILIGDSVAKQSNSKLLHVIRGNKTLVIDYDDAYKYRDSLISLGKY